MYNSKFICTYKDYPDLDMSDTMYRRDLLYAFGINDLDFEKNEIEITKEIFNLFNKMSDIEKIKTASKMTTSFFITHDLEYGFMALFSYNFFEMSILSKESNFLFSIYKFLLLTLAFF